MEYEHILTDIYSSTSLKLQQFNSNGEGFDAYVRDKKPSDLDEENSAWCDNFDKVKERKREDFRTSDTQCNATIGIVLKKVNRNAIKNDELLKIGFNVCINIKFIHFHRVNVAEAYSYHRFAPNIRETFFQYFDEGMTSASARNYHKLLIENS
ncbi:unnamed protein product [Psylliodes chrysocephalus]|uniref:Uncharacterized protein n=1 Tax=Psylliodes chrysocephalus TaxID=3402493 RepID=A0A9P0GIW8_9CUCU|nr:unnamed protein product [Psylliodes chrysocephala]